MKHKFYKICCNIAALSLGVCFFYGQNICAEEKEETS